MNNQKLIDSLKFSPDEQVVLIVRRSWPIVWWQLVGLTLLLLLPWFLLYPLWQWATYGPVIFLVLLGLGLWWLLRLYRNWYYNALVATTLRLIDVAQVGLFNRTISEVALKRVEDLSFSRQGLWQSLFNCGNLHYTIPPGQTMIEIAGVRRPQIVYQALTQLVETARPGNHDNQSPAINTAEQLRQLLKQMKQELGDDGFKKIISSLD